MPRAMLGDVEFGVVESENPEHSNEITDNPVEDGVDVTDHVRPMPLSFSISGVVTGDDAAQKLNLLRQYRENGQLLRYVGRNVVENVVIESLSTTHDVEVRNGFSFDITLREIRIVAKKETQYSGSDPAAKPMGNKGKQQLQRANLDPEAEASIMKRITG